MKLRGWNNRMCLIWFSAEFDEYGNTSLTKADGTQLAFFIVESRRLAHGIGIVLVSIEYEVCI
jgi:hypothetical protein